jgi:hypothetical protein
MQQRSPQPTVKGTHLRHKQASLSLHCSYSTLDVQKGLWKSERTDTQGASFGAYVQKMKEPNDGNGPATTEDKQ